MAVHDMKVIQASITLFAGNTHLDFQLFVRLFFNLIWGDAHIFQVKGRAKRAVRLGDRFCSLL